MALLHPPGARATDRVFLMNNPRIDISHQFFLNIVAALQLLRAYR